MATQSPRLVLGPDDHGRPVEADEFAEADCAEPWNYERVEGRLVVIAPEGQLHVEGTCPWWKCLFLYQHHHPEVVERIVPNAWVRIDDDTDRIGDIGVYLVADGPIEPIPDRVPDLMFEVVSPGRESHDRDYV